MYPEEYTPTESIAENDSHSGASGEEGLETVKMKMITSENNSVSLKFSYISYK